MVGLVPIENYVIPVVLLVNMRLIKGTWIILSCGLARYRAIPMVHKGPGICHDPFLASFKKPW